MIRLVACLTAWLVPALVAAVAGEYDASSSHWAFRPLQATRPPRIDSSWPSSPIDAFLLRAAISQGVQPAPDADTQTALRRLYFTLHGLPPSPEAVRRFLADRRPDRWSRLVDRLLASPRFGQRWARHWLDVARYADSSGGGRSLVFSESWRYRDYVIDTYNRDTPFEQFVFEQLAGDLLPATELDQRRRALIATGFLVIGPNNYETQNKRLLDYDIADEQIETVGKAFLGISLGCARCHDHKFDPVTTEEYYALAGIFLSTRSVVHDNVSRWYEVALPEDPELAERRRAVLERIGALEDELARIRSALAAFDGPYEDKPIDPRTMRGIIIEAEQATARGEWFRSTHSPRRIGTHYLHDGNKDKGQKALSFRWTATSEDTYLLRLAYSNAANRATSVPVEIHAGGETRLVRIDQTAAPPEGVFVRLGQVTLAAGSELVVTVRNDNTRGYVVVDALQILSHADMRQRALLAEAAESAKNELQCLRQGMPPVQRAMGVADRPPEEISDSPVLLRGQLDSPGARVRRSVPRFLAHALDSPQIPASTSGRLQLASWLVHPRNPLTWRVYVNRVWHWTFGTGLVRTVDNFGTTGEPPSHPDLLDFLAVRFQQLGGSTKRLVRELVCSRSFRVASRAQSLAVQLDPENRLFMRFTRRRLEAEALRDAMLSISGTLDTAMGGPSLPAALRKKGVEEKQVRSVPLDRRRSIYQPLLRNLTPGYFALFDGANPSVVCGRRFATVTPLQALYLMNSEFVLEQADATAERLLHEVDRDEDRVIRLFELVLCRHSAGRKESSASATCVPAWQTEPLRGMPGLSSCTGCSVPWSFATSIDPGGGTVSGAALPGAQPTRSILLSAPGMDPARR